MKIFGKCKALIIFNIYKTLLFRIVFSLYVTIGFLSYNMFNQPLKKPVYTLKNGSDSAIPFQYF